MRLEDAAPARSGVPMLLAKQSDEPFIMSAHARITRRY